MIIGHGSCLHSAQTPELYQASSNWRKSECAPVDDAATVQEVESPRHVEGNVLPRSVPGKALVR